MNRTSFFRLKRVAYLHPPMLRFCICLLYSLMGCLSIWAESDTVPEKILDRKAVLNEDIQELTEYYPNTTRNLKEAWQQLKQDQAFQYTKPDEQVERQKNSLWEKLWIQVFEFFNSSKGKVVIWIIVALLLIAFVYYILRNKGLISSSGKRHQVSLNSQEPELGIEISDDWNAVIQQMVGQGNYRMALRYGHRYLLQLLSDKGALEILPAKTNDHYQFELKNTPWQQVFRELTRQYEYSWYGGFDVNHQQFEDFYKRLLNLKQQLNKTS